VDLRASLRGLVLDRGITLFPLNNSTDVSRALGGSHWSLMVFVSHAPSTCRIWHVDSLHQSGNKAVAEAVVHALASVGCEAFLDCGVVEVPCAQQANGYDCGAFVLRQCERLVHFLRSSAATETLNLLADGPLRELLLKDVDAIGLRMSILKKVALLSDVASLTPPTPEADYPRHSSSVCACKCHATKRPFARATGRTFLQGIRAELSTLAAAAAASRPTGTCACATIQRLPPPRKRRGAPSKRPIRTRKSSHRAAVYGGIRDDEIKAQVWVKGREAV